jgi:DNA-binding response OmpR family regulator
MVDMASILLIEDDIQLQKMYHQMLTNEGYDVQKASNGDEGINFFHEKPADLVITDIIMPEKSGLDAISELIRAYPDVKIIAMSGGNRAGDKLLRMAQTLGAQRILRKPFSRAELISTVEATLK